MPVTRMLLPADLPGLRDLLLRLGPDDRALRFGRAVDDAEIEAHCRALARAGDDAVRAIGAFDGARLVGAAELWFDDGPPPRGCEGAIAVDAPWRGRGVGGGLLGHAALVACNRRVRRLRLACLRENRRMQRLAGRFARDLRPTGGGTEAEVLLPSPSWRSVWTEAAMDARGFAAAPAPGWRGPGMARWACPAG